MSASRRIHLPVRALSISALASAESRWKPSPPAVSLASDLSPAAIHALIIMCPIGVTPVENSVSSEYLVHYGQRTAQIARAVLDPDAEIQVILHAEDAPHLEAWRLLDLLVVPVLLGPPDDDAMVLEWVAALDSGALTSAEADAMGLRIRSWTEVKQILGVHGRKLSEARYVINKGLSDG